MHGPIVSDERTIQIMTSEQSTGARNWSLALLFCAAALNLFDRQIINILSQDIKTDLGLSDAQLGLLTGTAFGIFYALFGLALGRLADRLNRVRLIAASLALWSIFTMLCGTASSFVHLFLTRVGVGIGEAGSQPASTSLIPDLFPEERRVSAMSLLMVGGSVGSFVALLGGGYAAAAWGWRMAFVLAGIPGILLAILMVATMRDPRYASGQKRVVPPPLLRSLAAIVGNARFRWLTLGLLSSSFTVYAASAWLPPFFMRAHGMSITEVGTYSAIAVGVGGAIGTLGSGLLCDRLRSSVRRIELKLLLLSFGLGVPLLAVTVMVESRAAALGAWFLFNLVAFSWQGPTITLVQCAVAAENRGMTIAVASAAAMVVSQGIGLPLVGLLSDNLGGAYGPAAIGYALAICLAGAAMIGGFAHWRAQSS